MTLTTPAPTEAAEPAPAPRPRPVPTAGGTSRLRDERLRRVQLVMFTVGGVLMPFGILAICLGWYGSAHAHYEYDQNVYLISGGVLGLGLVFLGGFLYFGAWLSRMAVEQKHSAEQLTDAILMLADVVAVRQRGVVDGHDYGHVEPAYGYTDYGTEHLPYVPPAAVETTMEIGSPFVRAGSNFTVHRRDCALISSRPDLHEFVPDGSEVTTCRVCKPEL